MDRMFERLPSGEQQRFLFAYHFLRRLPSEIRSHLLDLPGVSLGARPQNRPSLDSQFTCSRGGSQCPPPFRRLRLLWLPSSCSIVDDFLQLHLHVLPLLIASFGVAGSGGAATNCKSPAPSGPWETGELAVRTRVSPCRFDYRGPGNPNL